MRSAVSVVPGRRSSALPSARMTSSVVPLTDSADSSVTRESGLRATNSDSVIVPYIICDASSSGTMDGNVAAPGMPASATGAAPGTAPAAAMPSAGAGLTRRAMGGAPISARSTFSGGMLRAVLTLPRTGMSSGDCTPGDCTPGAARRAIEDGCRNNARSTLSAGRLRRPGAAAPSAGAAGTAVTARSGAPETGAAAGAAAGGTTGRPALAAAGAACAGATGVATTSPGAGTGTVSTVAGWAGAPGVAAVVLPGFGGDATAAPAKDRPSTAAARRPPARRRTSRPDRK